MVPKLRFKEFCGEWEEKRLGDVADVLSGKRIPKGMSLSTADTGIKYITVSDMGEKYINNENIKYINEDIEEKIKKYKVSENDIIISVAGTLGKINIVTKDFQNANLTENCDKITNLRGIKHKYLYMYLNSSYIQGQINSIYTVSSQPKLALTRIRDFIINTPSLPEQTKIADFLSTVDDKIQNQQDKITHLENIKKGFMQKIFSRKIRFKDDGGDEFPEWEEKKLGDIVVFLDEKRRPLEKGERVSGIYPYYGASGIIDYVKDYIFDEELILLSEDGANIIDRNYRVCFLAKGKYWVNNHAHVLKAKKNYLNAFICESLERLNYQKYNTGTAQPKLNKEVCKKIILTIPCLKEQQKIADFLLLFDEKISTEKEILEHLKKLKKGLLQQMIV